MRPVLISFYLITLALWTGGAALFTFIVTPAIFRSYARDQAGEIVDRYDKCMCTGGDQKYYSAGNRLVTRDIQGVTIGLAICFDICWA